MPAATPAPLETQPAEAAVAAAVPVATPLAAATPEIVAPTPSPTPVKVALQPFLVSAPTPALGGNSASSWRTYSPGQMPRGRLVTLSDVGELAERGTGGERLYLSGNFVVTACGETQAVLRPNSGAIGKALATVTKQSSARIIVEFPAGQTPPPERTSVSRDEVRPFEIRAVRRDRDGQINVFAREVTTP